MEERKYDVVVIGSGMGGLCAAALLAHKGYKTLLVEKLPFVGGRASSIVYNGFTLITGSSWVETGGIVENIFKEVGADFEVRPFPLKLYFRIGGKDYEMPEKAGLKMLISLFTSEEEMERIMKAIRQAIAWQEPPNSMSAYEWLTQYTHNEKVLAIFRGLIGFQAATIYQMPAGEFIRELKLGRASVGIPPKGFLPFMEQLVKAIKAKGGEVWTRCGARRILVTDRVVKGVIVEKEGKEIEIAAKVVISNTGPRKTIELAGSNSFDKAYLKEVRDNVLPLTFVGISMASDRPLIEYPGMLMLTEARREIGINCLTLTCPELAPPGKHLLSACSVLGFSSQPLRADKELDLLVQDLRDNIPGFDKEAEILHTHCWQGDWPVFHALPGSLTQKTSVENLYNVGDGVMPLNGQPGLPACAESARIVVEEVKRRTKPGLISP